MRGMDYRRVREHLRALRVARKMGVPELAHDAGVNKTTLYRIEEITDDSDREIDLGTLEKLVVALGLTLSEFFSEIEGLKSSLIDGNNRTPSSPQVHGAGVLSRTATALPLDDTNAVIAANSSALVHLARTLERVSAELVGELRAAREQDAAPRAHKSRRPARPRKAG